MQNALNFLGLCMRSGRLVCGIPAAVQAVKGNQAHLVLLDASASANSKKEVTDACRYRDVPLLELPEGALGAAIGRPGRMAAAVTDGKLAQKLAQQLKNTDD